MTVQICKGNIFESGCEWLVNPVNAAGVSGKGLALEFAKRFPAQQEQFEEQCKRNRIKMGMVYVPLLVPENEPQVVFFPTKVHWKFKSNIRDIYEALVSLRQVVAQMVTRPSVAVPALGCGLGGLAWEGKGGVRAAIEYVFKNWPEIQVFAYESHD